MEVDKSMLESLTEEERRLVEQAGSAKDLVDLAQKSGVKLTEEQLDAIAGGDEWFKSNKCPKCGSRNIINDVENLATTCKCLDCGNTWVY